MFYIIDSLYSVIEEKDNVAFFDIETKKVMASFHIKKSHENNVAKLLNNPIDTNKLDGVWKKYFDMIVNKHNIFRFFLKVDEDIFKKEQNRFDRINEYVELNKNAYDMEEWALFAAVKLAVSKTCFCYIGKADFGNSFKGLHFAQYDNIREIKITKGNIYIIDSNENDFRDIEKFERIAVKEDLTRLYIKENARGLQIGPALYGSQFGCYLCNNHDNRDSFSKMQISELLRGLLDTELIKLSPNLIECMMQDNTISKGKIFYLDKYDLSAYQQDYICDINCKLCACK
ncbi:MAG: hypothetical protein ACI4EF_12580 [Coprococcus sp.]